MQTDEFGPIQQRPGQSAVQVRGLADPRPPPPPRPKVQPAADTPPPIPPGAAATEPGAVSEDKGVKTATAPAPAPVDYLVLCRSEGRRQKEAAMVWQVKAKFRQTLEKLAQRVARGKLKEPSKIQRAIGRVQQRFARVRRFYVNVRRHRLTVRGASMAGWRGETTIIISNSPKPTTPHPQREG